MDWVTIHSTNTNHEAALIKVQLELEEIDSILLDEHSSMWAPNFAHSSGGVRIQVERKNVERTLEFLTDHGYIQSESKKTNGLLEALSVSTSKVPLLNKLRAEARLMIVVGLIASILITLATLYID